MRTVTVRPVGGTRPSSDGQLPMCRAVIAKATTTLSSCATTSRTSTPLRSRAKWVAAARSTSAVSGSTVPLRVNGSV